MGKLTRSKVLRCETGLRGASRDRDGVRKFYPSGRAVGKNPILWIYPAPLPSLSTTTK